MAHSARPRLVPAVALAVALGASPTAPDFADEWQDPAVSGRNREPAHATMLPYATVEQALEGTRESSPFFLSLNRLWKFHYVDRPAERPRDFFREDFADGGWATIPVPSNWQLRGPPRTRTRQPFPPATTRSAPTARPSRSRPPGPAAASSCTSPASTARSTSG
jgi:hypothetical protein